MKIHAYNSIQTIIFQLVWIQANLFAFNLAKVTMHFSKIISKSFKVLYVEIIGKISKKVEVEMSDTYFFFSNQNNLAETVLE